nr:FAD-dependent oxidoreductase [Dictyobacter kobayashii]
MQTQQFDTLIIGFGKGGKTLANFLGNKGQKVSIVEQSKDMYGGTCINIACIPTKALALAAEHASSHHPNTHEEKQAYYESAIKEKQRLVTTLRQKNYDTLHNNPNVNVIDGLASFAAPTRYRSSSVIPRKCSRFRLKILSSIRAQSPMSPAYRVWKRVSVSTIARP